MTNMRYVFQVPLFRWYEDSVGWDDFDYSNNHDDPIHDYEYASFNDDADNEDNLHQAGS